MIFSWLLAFLLVCLALVLLVLLALVFYWNMPQGPTALLAITVAGLGVGICVTAFVVEHINKREDSATTTSPHGRPQKGS